MQLPPIEVVLSWPVGNYTNPSEVRGPAILVLTLIFIPLILLLVGARVYTRLRLTRNLGADDVVIVAALVPTMACAVITMLAVLYHGWNRHVWDVPTGEVEISLKIAMAVEILFALGCTLTKISILLLIIRIMASSSDLLRKLAIGMIVLVSIEALIFCIVSLNTCSPVSDYWTLSFTPQKCINEADHILVSGILNTLNDIIVVSIPIPVVLQLRLPLRQRIICAMLFGAGFIVCFAAGFRISYMYDLNTTYDKTWLAYPTWVCGTIELYLGIIATSIPATKPLVIRYFPNILGHVSTNGNYTAQSLDTYISAPQTHTLAHTQSHPASLPQPKSGPSMIEPIISTFSTYSEKDKKRSSRVMEWEAKKSRALGIWLKTGKEEASTKSSVSSFDVDTSWVVAPKSVASPEPARTRRVGSREGLVRYDHGSQRSSDDIV